MEKAAGKYFECYFRKAFKMGNYYMIGSICWQCKKMLQSFWAPAGMDYAGQHFPFKEWMKHSMQNGLGIIFYFSCGEAELLLEYNVINVKYSSWSSINEPFSFQHLLNIYSIIFLIILNCHQVMYFLNWGPISYLCLNLFQT